MADEGKTYEQVVIELTTNFETILKQDLTKYTTFVKKTGDTARSLEKSFTTMAKTVSDNVRGMFQSSTKEIISSVNASRLQMRQVMTQSIAVNDLYKKTFNELSLKQKEFQAEIKKSNDAVASIKPLKSSDKTKAGLVDQRKKEIEEKARQLTEQFKQETKQTLQQFYKSLGSLSAQASKVLVQISDTNLKSVQKTAKDLISQFKMIKSQMSMQTDVAQVTSGASKFKEMKAQNDNLQKALRDQAQLTYNAEVQMQQAKLAVIESTDKQILASNIKAFKETLVNQSKVREIYKQLEKDVYDYGKSVGKAEDEVKKMAQALQSSIKSGIKPTDITSKMNKAMDLLVEYARKTGMGMNDALFKNMRESSDVEAALNKSINKLKEMRSNALMLQKTGFVDTTKEVAKIDKVLAKYNEFWTKFKREQANVRNLLGKSNVPTTGATEFMGILKQYNRLASEATKYKEINEQNFLEVKDSIRKVEAAWEKVVSKRKAVNAKIEALNNSMFALHEAKNNASNAEIEAQYDRHLKRIEIKIKAARAKLASYAAPTTIMSGANAEIEQTAIKAQKRIRDNYLRTNAEIENSVKEIHEEYKKLIDVSSKTMNKRFVSMQSIEEAKKGFEDIKIKVGQYEKKIRDTQDAIRKLEKIQRAGFDNKHIQKLTESLRSNVATMRSYTKSLNDYATQAQHNIDKMQRNTSKSFMRSSWEAIRNFRWQVAAVIYLISRAAMALKRTVLKVLDNIQQFRMDAMSLAASYSMQMIGDIRDTYDRAYQFARNLMVQLEMTAAKTILTLEDMLMLTKTFAQAGMLPRTAEDVKNIATIGTAIKALTEGMANAGVQMRQELYAIIAGRQRATDQLAMMFKFIGVNIQDVIDRSKKEGVSMIKALSGALEPFNEMNRRMENEYSAVVNRLKVIWGIIQRIAGERVLVGVAEQLRDVADSLANITAEGEIQLTNLGKKIAMTLGASLESIRQLFEDVFYYVKFYGEILGIISETILNLTGSFSQRGQELTGVFRSIAATFELIVYSSTIFKGLLEGMGFAARTMAKMFNATAKYLEDILLVASGIITLNWSQLKKGLSGLYHAQDVIPDIANDFKNTVAEVDKMFAEIDKRLAGVYESLDGIQEKGVSLGETITVSVNIGEINKQVTMMKKKIADLELAGLEGIAKINRQYQKDTEDAKKIQEDIKKGIAETEVSIAKIGSAVGKAGDEGVGSISKVLELRLQNYNEQLETTVKYIDAAGDKRNKAIADYTAKQIKAMAQARRQWEVFMLELEGKPETKKDKTDKWFEVQQERVQELIALNNYGAEESQRAWTNLYKGYSERQKQDVRDIKDEMTELINSITSHDTLNEFEKIDNEFEKIYQKIKSNIELNDYQELQYMELAYLAKQRRIEEEKTASTIANTAKQSELLLAKAQYMQESFSPLEQTKGEILELRQAYGQALSEIDAKIKNTELMFMEKGEWIENSQAAQRYWELLRQEFVLTQAAFERDLFRKQHPLWNDLQEMSQNWADGLSDSLATLVVDFENFGDSIKSLWQSILQDTVKASIKRSLMDPLMDALGNGEGEGGSKLWRFGKDTAKSGMGSIADAAKKNMSEMDKLISEGRPMPVYVVESPDIKGLTNTMDETKDAVKETGKQTNETLNNGFSGMQSALTNIASGAASGNSSQMASGIMQLFSAVSSAYGGGMGGGAAAGATRLSNGAIQNASGVVYGMAEGGTISEHIVGKGLRSGRVYEFGERSKYGEFEDVVPKSKMNSGARSGQAISLSMPIYLSAIDTRSGVEFITQNQKVIENNMMRSMKNNKAIRGMIKQTW